uniref:HAUS augmin-like complex subunit 6 isoform X3 n=1 Tax=Gasterosteus aculeatus aculeatus TaxID=481459 RepID=UPI001A99912A|nr:HAUS augmin-like complex subunit 6 isoform X3 [Gasterosteus aculeatus aculeatus]
MRHDPVEQTQEKNEILVFKHLLQAARPSDGRGVKVAAVSDGPATLEELSPVLVHGVHRAAVEVPPRRVHPTERRGALGRPGEEGGEPAEVREEGADAGDVRRRLPHDEVQRKKNGRYLWFSLLGLGFQPDAEVQLMGGKTSNVKHINLGPNMFDKPNKDAFYIVTHFLLERLNPTRFHEEYRHCWPVLSHKVDADFRKVTCAWLREIMDETENAGSKVVASVFLSPGGPKFINVMLRLANHVMLQKMKTFTADKSWVPEAAAMPASSLDMATKRHNLIHTRFLKAAVAQDRFLRDYQRRAQVLVKSMREIRAEGAKYDELLKRHHSDWKQDGVSLAEKTNRVRSLWSDIDGMLSTNKEEQHIVESVLKGDVDQYKLDGTDRVLQIPRSLLERIEQLPHQLSSGHLYEGGQLNLLCVLELTNHALQLLREEHVRVSRAPKPEVRPQQLQERCQQMARALQNLHLIRQRISKEEIPEVRTTIKELEAAWDRKWMDTLRDTPLVSFLNDDPTLCFLSPMAPLSFEPAADTSYRCGVFSQYPATLLDKPAESKSPEAPTPSSTNLKSSGPATAVRSESPAVAARVSSQANSSLDWLFDTPPSPPLRAPSVQPPQASVRKTGHFHQKVATKRTKTPDRRANILDMECDNLADQFADAVTTTSPPEGRATGLDLDGLLGTLHGDPFSTRKQLTRTPESLILDVKTSWRKAVEEDEAEKSGRLGKLNCSVKGLLSPVNEQGVSSKSSLFWDTFNAEALDSPSGTGSSAVQFSLDQETLPEMPSYDSLLSLDDEAVDMKSEDDDEELLLSFLKSEEPPLTMRHHLAPSQRGCGNGSSVESRTRTPDVNGEKRDPTEGRDWPTAPAKSVDATDSVFSLDLDALQTPSPPRKQEYSLPKLITFSPIDDLKC